MKGNDSELLRAWRDGDAHAGNALFVRHFPALWRFFRSKASEDAEDLIQRTMLACVGGKDHVPDDAFQAYLFRIARNQLIDHYRRSDTRNRHFQPLDRSVHDLDPLASAVIGVQEEHKLLLAALRKLPLDVQLTMELYYWEGLSYAALADVLEVGTEAIKKRLQRGRAQLRELIETLGDGAVVTSTLTRLDDWARSLRDCIDAPPEAPRGR